MGYTQIPCHVRDLSIHAVAIYGGPETNPIWIRDNCTSDCSSIIKGTVWDKQMEETYRVRSGRVLDASPRSFILLAYQCVHQPGSSWCPEGFFFFLNWGFII